MTNLSRRSLLGGAALALPLAGCGRGTSNPEPSRDGDRSAEIRHRYGSTRAVSNPERVAVVGLLEQDVLLALGICPVSTTPFYGKAPGEIFPWAKKAFDATGKPLPKAISQTGGVPYEQIAELNPDLILAVYSGIDERAYNSLTEIAPTIAQPESSVNFATGWEQITSMVAAAVGRSGDGEQLISEVKNRIALDAEKHKALFEGSEAVFVSAVRGVHLLSPEDPRNRLIADLGLQFPDKLLSAKPAKDAFNWPISPERIPELLSGLDAVVWNLIAPRDPAANSAWNQTDTFKQGRGVDLSIDDSDLIVALAKLTPLSIPWALDSLVPKLIEVLDN